MLSVQGVKYVNLFCANEFECFFQELPTTENGMHYIKPVVPRQQPLKNKPHTKLLLQYDKHRFVVLNSVTKLANSGHKGITNFYIRSRHVNVLLFELFSDGLLEHF